MKVTLTIETDSPVLHLTATGRDKVKFNVQQKTVSLNRLSDNSIILKDVKD
jgi:hypothetical protein